MSGKSNEGIVDTKKQDLSTLVIQSTVKSVWSTHGVVHTPETGTGVEAWNA